MSVNPADQLPVFATSTPPKLGQARTLTIGQGEHSITARTCRVGTGWFHALKGDATKHTVFIEGKKTTVYIPTDEGQRVIGEMKSKQRKEETPYEALPQVFQRITQRMRTEGGTIITNADIKTIKPFVLGLRQRRLQPSEAQADADIRVRAETARATRETEQQRAAAEKENQARRVPERVLYLQSRKRTVEGKTLIIDAGDDKKNPLGSLMMYCLDQGLNLTPEGYETLYRSFDSSSKEVQIPHGPKFSFTPIALRMSETRYDQKLCLK